MHAQLTPALKSLLSHQHLSAEQMSACVAAIMDGECDGIDIAAFLAAHAVKGFVPEELTGAARAMRARATRIESHHSPLLDTCGTGGDGLHTFNISTATALVAAACGVPVAKHGNRSVSSSSGSADVLEALGVNISLPPGEVGRCLDELGIGFCFAPLIHGAMKFAAPIRRQLAIPTIFNLLGPLTNPAGAECQVLGAASVQRAELIAEALSGLKTRRSLVVCGNNQIDEVCLWGKTTVFEVVGETIRKTEWTGENLGLPPCTREDLRVRDAQESAAMIRGVLQGTDGPATHMVAANTAAALVAVERVATPAAGVHLALETLTSGKAADLLARLVNWTNQNGSGTAK